MSQKSRKEPGENIEDLNLICRLYADPADAILMKCVQTTLPETIKYVYHEGWLFT